MSGQPPINTPLERLRRGLARAEALARGYAGSESSDAAVLVPVLAGSDDLRFVYIRRSETVDSHRGQIAFPGGRVEPGDTSMLATALREANEEVGLSPDAVEVLGGLFPMRTLTSAISVTPFVGLIASAQALRPSSPEVAEVFDVPLAALRDPRRRGTFGLARGDTHVELPAILYSGRTIWGLTFRLTIKLLEIIDAAAD